MPIYEFACDDCRRSFEFEMAVSSAGSTLTCPKCERDMRRVYYAPALMNRSKPGSFKWEKSKLNAQDDRLAGFRYQESLGTQSFRAFKENFGKQVSQQVLNHKKEKYVS